MIYWHKKSPLRPPFPLLNKTNKDVQMSQNVNRKCHLQPLILTVFKIPLKGFSLSLFLYICKAPSP